jgi:isoquinoline 1-oxidoreductase subunit beta
VVAPAIANAVAKLTGKRVRRLPITAQALKQTAVA